MTNTCGIYQITNTITGGFYIGSSCNIERRLAEHRRTLVNSRHRNPHLQNSWNKYGEDNFEFTTILLCDKSMTLYCEQELLDLLKPAYNIATCAAASQQGLTRSEEQNRNSSEAHKGQRPSAEARRSISATMKGNTNSLGYKHTEETKRINSEAHIGNTYALGHKHTEAALVKMREAKKGKRKSEETRRKMSEAHKRRWAEWKSVLQM